MQNRKRGKSGVCVYSSQKAGKQGEKRGYQKREWGKEQSRKKGRVQVAQQKARVK